MDINVYGAQRDNTRFAVCELQTGIDPTSEAWFDFASRATDAAPDCLLMNEMPFGPWLSNDLTFSKQKAEVSLRAHSAGLRALHDLGLPAVISSAPDVAPPVLSNEAFLLQQDGTRSFAHQKHYFPQERHFYERSWFRCYRGGFDPMRVGKLLVGVLLCTELFFNEWARHYGRLGVHVILVPRASGGSAEHWRTAAKMAAIVSGSYVLSSNHSGRSKDGFLFGGHGFAFGPRGELLAETSQKNPLQVVNINIAGVQAAKREYPCNVPELLPSAHVLDDAERARA